MMFVLHKKYRVHGSSACYEISASINADIADKVYQEALGKNLSVAQIKAEIAKAKGIVTRKCK
jgi:hypothetical protein